MRCIRTILKEWSEANDLDLHTDEFDVRLQNTVPDTSYDIYISTGGPGDPLITRFDDWDISWCRWLNEMERWNNNPDTVQKNTSSLFVILFNWPAVISTQALFVKKVHIFWCLPCAHAGGWAQRRSLSRTKRSFYAVDSRDFQVIQPNIALLEEMGASLLCIEKSRPHVPLERAVMAIRFNDYMIGTQFHPEADAPGMLMYLKTEEKERLLLKITVKPSSTA